MLLSGILTADVIFVTITGKKVPADKPEKVTSVELPTGLTVIDVTSASVSVKVPIYIAPDWIPVIGKALTVSTIVAKSG